MSKLPQEMIDEAVRHFVYLSKDNTEADEVIEKFYSEEFIGTEPADSKKKTLVNSKEQLLGELVKKCEIIYRLFPEHCKRGKLVLEKGATGLDVLVAAYYSTLEVVRLKGFISKSQSTGSAIESSGSVVGVE